MFVGGRFQCSRPQRQSSADTLTPPQPHPTPTPSWRSSIRSHFAASPPSPRHSFILRGVAPTVLHLQLLSSCVPLALQVELLSSSLPCLASLFLHEASAHPKLEWKCEMLRVKVIEGRRKGWKLFPVGFGSIVTCRWDGSASWGNLGQSVPR